MARMTQKELEQAVLKRQQELNVQNDTQTKEVVSDQVNNESDSNVKKAPSNKSSLNDDELKNIASDIIGEKSKSTYSVPNSNLGQQSSLIPKINISDYPSINIKGQFPSNRQRRTSNLILLKEIDAILENRFTGNKNACLNFLIWVGLETLKGVNQKDIAINVNSGTFADGRLISEYQKLEELV